MLIPYLKAMECSDRGGRWDREASVCADLVSLPHPPPEEPPSIAEQEACAAVGPIDAPSTATYWPTAAFRIDPALLGRIRGRDTPESESVVDDLARSTQQWFAEELCALGEPPLSAPIDGGVRVRVMAFPSFRPGMLVRIEHTRTRTRLVAIEFSPQFVEGTGGESRRVERDLTALEWRELQELIRADGFWRSVESGPGPPDSTLWIIEVSESDRYNVISRAGDSRIGQRMLELTGFEIAAF